MPKEDEQLSGNHTTAMCDHGLTLRGHEAHKCPDGTACTSAGHSSGLEVPSAHSMPC